ncbi:kinase-like protein [Wilcoxina mikolae CBS 423.85]|nr:kinase-like protein [Wilcoxina mikolae CBS 423.85]
MANTRDVNECNKLCSEPKLEFKIESGSFGVVFLAEVRLEAEPELCAVKRMSKGNYNIPRRKYEREIVTLARLQEYEWFVQLIGWYEDDNWIYIAMEYMEFGDLGSYIKNKWTEEDTKVVARQLLEGLKVMHEDGILHRDLKPENIFPILLDGKFLRIKIGDFGVSKRVSNDSSTIAITQTGSLGYMAPEVLSGSQGPTGYTKAVDLWSLGCILYRMLVGEVPFATNRDVYLYDFGQMRFPRHELNSVGLSEVGIDLFKALSSRIR